MRVKLLLYNKFSFMAQRYSTEEVLQFVLDDDDDEFYDPQEIIMDGNDKEFEDIDELNDVELDHGNIVKYLLLNFFFID